MPDAMVGFSHVEGEFRFGVTLTVTFNTTHKVHKVGYHGTLAHTFTEIEKNIFFGGGFLLCHENRETLHECKPWTT